jgi:hypothetical protein
LIKEKAKSNTKHKNKPLMVNILLRKEVWNPICGVGNIHFEGTFFKKLAIEPHILIAKVQ